MRKILFLLLSIASACLAHIGSPDVYLDGNAGPYRLFVTIRPPQVIPGIAEISVRTESPGVNEIRAVPMPLTGAGSDHPPVPDVLKQASGDRQFFTGALWLMADGSWQVRLAAKGDQGEGTLSVPVPAMARTTRTMNWQLGAILTALALFLIVGLIAITGAAVREAKVPEGEDPSPASMRTSRIAMAVAFVVIAIAVWGGKHWWDNEIATFENRIYKPLGMKASLYSDGVLTLDLSEPGWMQPKGNRPIFSRVLFVRKMDDLVLDHDHLMHLYAVRTPGMDAIYHLHPEMNQTGEFRLKLPNMPAGDYRLFADVVHENGLPETLTSEIHTSGIAHGRPVNGDDAIAAVPPLGGAPLGDTFHLPDGFQMKWLPANAPLHAREGMPFRFQLLTPDGKTPADMALYMGMVGHAAFLKSDFSVFAHIHPNGTVPMSAMMTAQQGDPMAGMDHSQMNMRIPNEVAFPYGLPSPGKYRIFVQMKHGGTIETGAFDAVAE